MPPTVLPISASLNNQRIGVAFTNERIYVTARWNTRDASWYLDLYREDDTPIAVGLKVVLGVALGIANATRSEWLQTHQVRAIDTSGEDREAGFDDIGTRVVVMVTTLNDVVKP